MDVNHFFKDYPIIRGQNIQFTYAMGQELENSIAYAQDSKTLNVINKFSHISMIITTPQLAEKVCTEKSVVVSENPQRDFFM